MKRRAALAICTTALGDTLLCTPAVASLGAAYELDVLTHQRRRELFLHNPQVSRVLPYRNNALVRAWLSLRLRSRFYEAVAVLHANDDILKLLPHLRFGKAGNIQGWEKPELGLGCLALEPALHVLDKRLLLAQWAGGAEVQDKRMRVYLTAAEGERAEEWLLKRGLGPENPRVALCPGAAYPYKMWPARSFGGLAKGLAEMGVICLVVGSAPEERLAHEVRMAAGVPTVNALGLPLRQACALLSRLDLLITNDTGPMHMAQAVDAPVLALFGPTDPATIGPRGDRAAVIKAEPTCQPCTTKACRQAECMAAISVESVLAKAREMLAKGRARPGR